MTEGGANPPQNCPQTLSTYDLCVYKYFRLLVLWCFVLWVVVGLRERSIYSGWCCVSICQPGAWFTSGPLWSQLYNVLGAHACLLLGGVAGSRPEEPSQDKEATPTSRAMNLRIPRQGSLDKKNDLCWHLLDPYLWAILFFINLNESNHIFQKRAQALYIVEEYAGQRLFVRPACLQS